MKRALLMSLATRLRMGLGLRVVAASARAPSADKSLRLGGAPARVVRNGARNLRLLGGRGHGLPTPGWA